jgi:hypothetical protein
MHKTCTKSGHTKSQHWWVREPWLLTLAWGATDRMWVLRDPQTPVVNGYAWAAPCGLWVLETEHEKPGAACVRVRHWGKGKGGFDQNTTCICEFSKTKRFRRNCTGSSVRTTLAGTIQGTLPLLHFSVFSKLHWKLLFYCFLLKWITYAYCSLQVHVQYWKGAYDRPSNTLSFE